MKESSIIFIKDVASILAYYHLFTEDIRFWIGCQFGLESSFGESPLANSLHNYCGMQTPLVRPSTAYNRGISSPSDYWAQFCDLHACILDYVLCITYHRPLSKDIEDLDMFRTFISKFYCSEKDYIDKINRIYSQFKSSQNE